MASLDSLPADQRAVLQLVLQRGHSFDEIAAMLSIDRAAVRRRALEGFDLLGPENAISAPQRALLTDYLLGQLPPRVADQVRRELGRSRADRAWLRAIADEVGPLASKPLAEIPDDPAEPVVVEPVRPQTPAPEPASSRRGGAILLGGVAAVVIAAIVVIIVVGNSGSSRPKHRGTASVTRTSQTTVPASSTGIQTGTGTTIPTKVKQVNLLAPHGARKPLGIAQVLRRGTIAGIVIVASGLPPNTSRDAYAVWLYNSPASNQFLGFFRTRVGRSGRLQAEDQLPSGAARYRRMLITVETEKHPTRPGRVVLSGRFEVP